MSEDISKALARIAAMEQELSTLRAAPKAAPSFDPTAFARALAADPVSALSKMGVPVEHVTKYLVAHALGDQAPVEARFAASQGQAVSAQMAVQSELQALRQRVESFEAREASTATRTSLQKLAANKSKHPFLSAAIAADPSLFDGDVAGHKGDAATLAESIEKRLAATAAALGVKAPQPASSESADTTGQSTQATAQAGGIDPTPPPIVKSTPGTWNDAEHAKLRDAIVKQSQVQTS